MNQTMMIWAVAAMLLIAAELVLPEIFLLWLGIAAGAMFFVVWAVPGLAPMWQAVGFVLLSFVSIGVYVKFIRGRLAAPDRPMLNKRGEQLVGRVLPLHEAIVNGQGRVKFGDALWTVEGPDLPAGTSVRVVGASSMTLQVVPN
jgi:membrane protein implicated in regulation of membrane protease activity